MRVQENGPKVSETHSNQGALLYYVNSTKRFRDTLLLVLTAWGATQCQPVGKGAAYLLPVCPVRLCVDNLLKVINT